MGTVDRLITPAQDYSITTGYTPVLSRSDFGTYTDQSDPRFEWAIRFDERLKRATERIRAWTRNPSSLADEGLSVPSPEAIKRAFEIIREMRVQAMDRVSPPIATLLHFRGVAPGTDGEIYFELEAGPFALTYQVEPDASVIELFFRDNRLIRRERIR